MTRGRSVIIDMGYRFDGRCVYCRDWIVPSDPIYNQAVPNQSGHTIAHATCSVYGPLDIVALGEQHPQQGGSAS